MPFAIPPLGALFDSPVYSRPHAACKALAEARRVDEVKSIHDKAKAMEVYAKQAKDGRLMRHASEIRVRAERRAGELLQERTAAGLYGKGKRKSALNADFKTHEDLGITEHESADWQKLASITPENFLEAMNEALQNGEWRFAVFARAPDEARNPCHQSVIRPRAVYF